MWERETGSKPTDSGIMPSTSAMMTVRTRAAKFTFQLKSVVMMADYGWQ
jgi:hypothetical protein